MSYPRCVVHDQTEKGVDGREYQYKVMLFECPGCGELHGPAVQGSAPPGRPVWDWNGSIETPTISPSLLVRWEHGEERRPMVCHSFIREGRIEFLGDCTHALAGQTVDLLPWPPP